MLLKPSKWQLTYITQNFYIVEIITRDSYSDSGKGSVSNQLISIVITVFYSAQSAGTDLDIIIYALTFVITCYWMGSRGVAIESLAATRTAPWTRLCPVFSSRDSAPKASSPTDAAASVPTNHPLTPPYYIRLHSPRPTASLAKSSANIHTTSAYQIITG